MATFNINERARLRFSGKCIAFGYEIVFETVHQYYICRFVEQFLALVIGDFTYCRKTVYMMRRLLLDGMLRLHIQFLCHLIAIIRKQIVIQRLMIARLSNVRWK